MRKRGKHRVLSVPQWDDYEPQGDSPPFVADTGTVAFVGTMQQLGEDGGDGSDATDGPDVDDDFADLYENPGDVIDLVWTGGDGSSIRFADGVAWDGGVLWVADDE